MDRGQIVSILTQGGKTKIEVRLANKSVWLAIGHQEELFQRISNQCAK